MSVHYHPVKANMVACDLSKFFIGSMSDVDN